MLVETKKKFQYASACPCDLQLAASDGSWTFDWRTFVSNPASKTLCYYEQKTDSDSSQVRVRNVTFDNIITVSPGFMYGDVILQEVFIMKH